MNFNNDATSANLKGELRKQINKYRNVRLKEKLVKKMENTKAGKLHTNIFVITFSKKYFCFKQFVSQFKVQVFQGLDFSGSRLFMI